MNVEFKVLVGILLLSGILISGCANSTTSKVCSTNSFENLCASLDGSYYCKQASECGNYCQEKCQNLGYTKLISSSGRTQTEKLVLTRVYCTCSCEKCS